MRYGFNFNGIHSSAVEGLTVKTVSRPITPDMRDTKIIIPYADNVYSTAYANMYKRAFYNSRIFTVSMQLTASDITSLGRKLSEISEWLTGSGVLVFDDMPLVEWSVVSIGAIDYAPERHGTKAVMSVSFEVQPYAALSWYASEGPHLGHGGVCLGDNIPLNPEGEYTAVMSGKSMEMEILNFGRRYVRPVITIKTSGSNTSNQAGRISISANGTEGMEVYCPGREMTVDCRTHTIKDGSGKNIISEGFCGSFIELMPGRNTLVFTRDNAYLNGDIDIKVDFKPMVMWNFDFELVEWEKNTDDGTIRV